MGEVYRARDARLARDVAVKVLPASFAGDADRLRRFEQEARATGQLNHPNILAVYDFGSHDGAPFVVSELLEGDTLRERIGGTALPTRKAIDFATQVARGLAAAHEKGIVHRDLKPDNVFVTKDGRVKILDFGLAKLVSGEALAEAETNTRGAVPGTDAGKVMGTVGYMSPEQVRAQPADHRSDIFSFGSLLYEMLSGRRAFRGPSAIETMNAILKEDPPPISETNRNLPPALERIVSHCLEKNPEERFQSARDIAFDLEQLSGTSASGMAPVASGPRVRFGLPASVAAGVLLLGLGAGAGYLARGGKGETLSIERVTFRRQNVNTARFAPDGVGIVYEIATQTGPAVIAARDGSSESRDLGLGNARLAGVAARGDLAVLLRRNVGGERTLAIVPMGGGAPRDLIEHVEAADWSADGSQIAVSRWTGGGLSRLEFPPGKELFTAPRIQGVRVAPKGDAIAFRRQLLYGDSRGRILILDASGRTLAESSDFADLGALAWAHDGRTVYFSATESGAEHSIYALERSGAQRHVYRVPGSVDVYDVAADGRMLVGIASGEPQLFGRGRGAPSERELTWLDFGVVRAISDDGRFLLFDEQGQGGGPAYSSYLRGLDGAPPVRLGDGSGMALSPDGRFALVLDLREPRHLVVLPTGAGQPRPLPRGPVVNFHKGDFVDGGDSIGFLGNAEGQDVRLWRQDLKGGDPVPFSPVGVNGPPSPDGSFALDFTPQDVQRVDLKSGERRPLAGVLPSDDYIRFSRDGRSVIVRARGDHPADVFRVDLETGRRQPLLSVGRGMGASGLMRAVVTTDDGSAYAYMYLDPVDTLYVVRGLR
jgi:Tol biopolymer transport system component